jgi:hypothetical protein
MQFGSSVLPISYREVCPYIGLSDIIWWVGPLNYSYKNEKGY